MTSTESPVDFVIVGLGNPDKDFAQSRHNVGFIFCDYLANCIASQLEQGDADAERSHQPPVVIPKFVRRGDLVADVHNVVYMVPPSNEGQKAGVKKSELKAFRLLLVKPLTGMNNSGLTVQKILSIYGIKSPAKQLIVVFDDMNTLPASIALQNRGDLRSVQGHKGVESIASYLKTGDFIRFRIGIGRPPTDVPVTSYVLSSFGRDNKEMDYIAHALDITAQALQFFASTGDFKETKKKFANSKKVPKNLRKMEGLVFPIETVGA